MSARTIVCLAVLLSACAARVPPRPAGDAVPDPTAAAAFAAASASCAGLKTMTGELRLSGRAGGEKIRGTLLAGLAAPASIRLEAVAPFGAPVFILAGRDNRATLLFPRDDRVIADAGVAEIFGRLTGLDLGAHDLRLILTACLVEAAAPTNGRRWSDGWRAVTVGDGVTAYLRDVGGRPAIVAADRGAWRIDYSDHQNGIARTVRIRSGEVDISAAITQLELNTAIDDRAFVVNVPAGAERLTVEHLKSVAPLRSQEP